MPPLLVLAQAATSNPFTSVMNNPSVAMDAILALAQQYHVVPVLREIGMALLALFALLETYRLWIGSDVAGLTVLGVKVILVNYFISAGSPILGILKTVYGYFAYAGQTIVSTALQQDWNQIQNVLSDFYNLNGNHSWIWTLSHFVPVLLGDLLIVLYFLVLAILFGLYTFAVIASRLFIVLSIVLIPLIFPLTLWAPLAQSYMGKWVSTTIHAILLPLVGAIALVAAVHMGALTPLQDIAACLKTNSASANPLDCVGFATGSMVSGLIGSLAAIFLMFGLDGIVRSFVGGAEISTAGIIAARWAAGAPGRVAGAMQAAGRARQAAGPQTTTTDVSQYQWKENLPGGTANTRTISTSTSQKIPQSRA